MIINAGILVFLLGLPLVVFLFYQANNRNVSPYNREPCGIAGTILSIVYIIAIILCFANANDASIDCSKLIQFKSDPTTSQRYNNLTNN